MSPVPLNLSHYMMSVLLCRLCGYMLSVRWHVVCLMVCFLSGCMSLFFFLLLISSARPFVIDWSLLRRVAYVLKVTYLYWNIRSLFPNLQFEFDCLQYRPTLICYITKFQSSAPQTLYSEVSFIVEQRIKHNVLLCSWEQCVTFLLCVKV